MSLLSVNRLHLCDRVFKTWSRLRTTVRVRPYDTSTEEGRSQERLRRVGLSALASLAAKVVGMAAWLISVPLTTTYLGAERFGIWMTVLSLTGLLGMADLGIGNGVVSLVAEAHGRNDREAARRLVSNAFFLLFCIGAMVAASVVTLRAIVPWDRLLGFPSSEARAAAVLALFLFGIGLPLGLAQRVLAAYQEGFAAGLWNLASGVLSLLGVVVAVQVKSGIFGLVLAVSVAPVLVGLMTCVVVPWRQMPWLRPKSSDISKSTIAALLRMGSAFLSLQIAMAVGFNSDSLVLAHVAGASAVAEYSVTAKLFGIPQLLISYVLAPLWPAYGEAIANGDVAWVRRTLRRSLRLSLTFMLVAAGALVAIGHWLVLLWTRGSISAGHSLLLTFGLWAVVTSIGGPLAAFLNGAKVMGFQIIVSFVSAAGNIALSIFLARRIGAPGVVLGSIISQVVLNFIPYSFFLPRLFTTIEKRAIAAKRDRVAF